MAINIETVKKERELVSQNISALEAQINQLTSQLQQAQSNLIASKGAVIGFDRLIELSAEAPKEG